MTTHLTAMCHQVTPGPMFNDLSTRSVRSIANMRGEDGRAPFVICRFPMRTATSAPSHDEGHANSTFITILLTHGPALIEALEGLILMGRRVLPANISLQHGADWALIATAEQLLEQLERDAQRS